MFAPQFEALKSDYRCIGLDWRGQGKSEMTLGGYDVDMLAYDCMALMTHLGIEQFHWVGLSIGGVIGIRMAAEQPARIKSLFAIGAAADCEPYEKLAKYESLFDKNLQEGFEAIREPMAPILRRRDIRYLLPYVKCPTFVTTGEHDGANGPKRAQMIHDGIAHSALDIIPRAGHTATIEEPVLLNAMLLKFLDAQA